MLRRITLVAASVAVLCLSAQAFAATAQTGIYVGGQVGWSFASATSDGTIGATSSQNKNYVYGPKLGFDYALNQNVLVGVEASYLNFGNTSYTNAGIGNNVDFKESSSGYQLLATSTYLLNSGWNGFVKAGAIRETTKGINNNTLNGTSIDSVDVTKAVPATVIGVGYMVRQNTNLVLQWEHVYGQSWDTQGVATKPMTQNAITLGASYKFAM
jgi:opacity protein-like surface antigen